MNKSMMGAVTEAQTPTEEAPREKEDFRTVAQQQADMAAGKKKSADQLIREATTKTDGMIDQANSILSGGDSSKDFDDFEELEKISQEDLDLAEQVIFKGYAEKDLVIPNLSDHQFTICTTSAEDMSVVDEIMYDMVKAKESDDGVVDLPAQHVQTMRAAIMLALGFKGMDGSDYCDEPINQLMTIKRAIIKVKDLEYEGDMDQSQKLCDSLKKSLKHRAVRIRRLPTPVIDFLSGAKFEFDTTMFRIMSSKKLIPKSSGQSQDSQGQPSSTREDSSDTDQ